MQIAWKQLEKTGKTPEDRISLFPFARSSRSTRDNAWLWERNLLCNKFLLITFDNVMMTDGLLGISKADCWSWNWNDEVLYSGERNVSIMMSYQLINLSLFFIERNLPRAAHKRRWSICRISKMRKRGNVLFWLMYKISSLLAYI